MRSACLISKCRSRPRRSGARSRGPDMRAGAGHDRRLGYAIAVSIAVHALVLYGGIPVLRESLQEPVAPPPLMTRLVELPKPAEPAPPEEKKKPPEPKRQVPRPEARRSLPLPSPEPAPPAPVPAPPPAAPPMAE